MQWRLKVLSEEKVNYRTEARDALKRAKNELSHEDDSRAKYAALELRMALESLIYDISKSYREELSETDFNTWQPKKLLEFLIEIDPSVEKKSEWRIGKQEQKGELPAVMSNLGVDRRLTLKEIKSFYDRFGNYLHTLTIKQLEDYKKLNYSKLKNSCNELINILDEVLSSAVFNTRMKVTSKISCWNCSAKIVKNIPKGQSELTAKCRECGASYTVRTQNGGAVIWEPQLFSFSCGGKDCSESVELFEAAIKEGSWWICKSCNGRNTICLGVSYEKPNN
jgi:hypothetical protein